MSDGLRLGEDLVKLLVCNKVAATKVVAADVKVESTCFLAAAAAVKG